MLLSRHQAPSPFASLASLAVELARAVAFQAELVNRNPVPSFDAACANVVLVFIDVLVGLDLIPSGEFQVLLLRGFLNLEALNVVHNLHHVGADGSRLVDVHGAGSHDRLSLGQQMLHSFHVDREAPPTDHRHHASENRVVVAGRRTAKMLVKGSRVPDVVRGIITGVRSSSPMVNEVLNDRRPCPSQQLSACRPSRSILPSSYPGCLRPDAVGA